MCCGYGTYWYRAIPGRELLSGRGVRHLCGRFSNTNKVQLSTEYPELLSKIPGRLHSTGDSANRWGAGVATDTSRVKDSHKEPLNNGT